jgi:pyrroline-5-carboxylate reductase
LVAELPSVRRAHSNAEVVEGSAIVVLTVRPPQFREAVTGLPFRAGQMVVSCLAKTSLEDVATLVAPAAACRMIPLPSVEFGAGPLVIYPPLPVVSDIFGKLGFPVVAETEAELRAYSAASATMSTFFALQAEMVNWLAGQGAPRVRAQAYVASMHQALAETSARFGGDGQELILDHETPGGINERVRRGLTHAGWFGALGSVLDKLADLSGDDLQPAPRDG